MARMSPMDRAFFLLETEQRPMNVGALIVLRGRKPRQGRASDALVRKMLRCPVGAPFNQRLAENTLAGWPTLVDNDRIDPAEQLFRHELPADSEVSALLERVCALHSRRLDRCRPLWEMHVFDGLAGGRIGLYFKTHHGLIDGIGFIRVVLNVVSRSAATRRPQAIWQGLPQTAAGQASAPSSSAAGLLQAGLKAGRTAADLARLVWHVGRRDAGLGRGMTAPFIATPDVLKAPPSANRVMGHCALPLARVRGVARRADAKINDVLLATLDVALNHYLAEHGVQARRPLVADMPVALHDCAGAGNRITILQVPLGHPGATPAERLDEIVAETRLVKDEVRAVGADALFMYSILEHAVASAIESLNLSELPMLANAVISNPAGLNEKVYFNGLPVELALPVSVVAHHQVLNITISNYADELHVTFIALKEAIPDVQRLADSTMLALVELQRSVAQRAIAKKKLQGAKTSRAGRQRNARPAAKRAKPAAAARPLH